jgi:hypothetical protein
LDAKNANAFWVRSNTTIKGTQDDYYKKKDANSGERGSLRNWRRILFNCIRWYAKPWETWMISRWHCRRAKPHLRRLGLKSKSCTKTWFFESSWHNQKELLMRARKQ